MNDIEKAILDMFENKYHKRYVGGLKVTKLTKNPEGYKLILYLGNKDVKLIEISADLNVEDFLKFIESEIIERQLHRTQWFRGIQIYNEDETGRTCCKD